MFEDFVEQPWYIEGETPIPKDLQSFHNKTHTGGVRDKKVLTVNKFASEINSAMDDVELLYREKQTLEAVTKLGLSDSDAVKRLQQEFKRLLYGENGKDLEALEFAIGSGRYTFQQRRDEIFADMANRFDQIIAAPAVIKMSDAVGDLLRVRDQVNKNPDLLYLSLIHI